MFDRVIGDAKSSAVVSDNGSGRLGIAKFLEACTNGACFFAIVEESGKFGFGGAGDNFTQYLAKYIDSTIGGRWRVIRQRRFGRIHWAAAEELVSGGARASFGCCKVGSIAFNVEDHVTGTIADDGIRVRSAVV